MVLDRLGPLGPLGPLRRKGPENAGDRSGLHPCSKRIIFSSLSPSIRRRWWVELSRRSVADERAREEGREGRRKCAVRCGMVEGVFDVDICETVTHGCFLGACTEKLCSHERMQPGEGRWPGSRSVYGRRPE